MLCKHHVIISGHIRGKHALSVPLPFIQSCAVTQKNNTVLSNMLNIYDLKRSKRRVSSHSCYNFAIVLNSLVGCCSLFPLLLPVNHPCWMWYSCSSGKYIKRENLVTLERCWAAIQSHLFYPKSSKKRGDEVLAPWATIRSEELIQR